MTIGPMEVEPINATQQSLVRIFSDEYLFSIPPYQRPYAWEETQARELLDDLSMALEDAKSTHAPVSYFLGSIVLIKRPGAPQAEVVDGQQRLTTLTILLAVLRDLSQGRTRQKRNTYVCEEGDPDRGTHDRYRLSPRRQDQSFFRSYVQELGSTSNIVGNEGQTESQKHMIANAQLYRAELTDWSEADRDELVQFLIQRCYLVVISVVNFETAHRVFTVLNARGLDLAPTDILKADLLDRAAKQEEQALADAWENHETALGREQFVELFQHIRMIYQREKPRERLEVGFPKYVAAFGGEPSKFMSGVLGKFARTFELILSPDAVEQRFGCVARDYVDNLRRLDNSDWLPVAINYLSNAGLDEKGAEAFLWRLERLGYYMFVMRDDINTRISRYAKVISELEDGVRPGTAGSELVLSTRERSRFLDELDGPIYEKTRVRLPLLLCLDAAFSDGGATYRRGIVTVEHVLPQNPQAGSKWFVDFPNEEERLRWTHRLGNLVLLTRAKNSQASNWEFDRKKQEYFSAKAGVASYKLTSMVLSKRKWDRQTLHERHREMLGKLNEKWNLNFDEWEASKSRA